MDVISAFCFVGLMTMMFQADPSQTLAIPINIGTVTLLGSLALSLITTIVVLTRKYDGWETAAELSKIIHGDPKATTEAERIGLKRQVEELVKVNGKLVKILLGDSEAEDELAKRGMISVVMGFTDIVPTWIKKVKALMRGMNIPTDISDEYRLEEIVRQKNKRRNQSHGKINTAPTGLPQLPPPRPIPRTPPFSTIDRREPDSEDDQEDEEG